MRGADPHLDSGNAFDGPALVTDDGVGGETHVDGGWVVRVLGGEIDPDRRR